MTAQAERAAAAVTYWARQPRRDAEAARGAVIHLSEAERAETANVIRSGVFNGLSDDALVAIMFALASKSRPVEEE